MPETLTRAEVRRPIADPTLVGALRAGARARPDRVALRFLADGGTAATRTYAELDGEARGIAEGLRRRGLAGRRALMIYPSGPEFVAAFFGCLYAGVVAVPVEVPRRNRPMPRLAAIAADAAPSAVLTARSLRADADRWAAEAPALRGLPVLATDAEGRDAPGEPAGPRPDDLAFLQYTSGSTATPKGVMISHRNLMANADRVRDCFGSAETDRGVFWLPLHHDMGLIGGVLQTIACGGTSTLMSPVAFLQRPRLWLETITQAGATISGGPDFAYDLCARKIPPDQRAGLDLSRWAVAFTGAEPVRAETLDRFADAFAGCGFRREAFLPCYGLAESTLLVSGRRPPGGPVVVPASAEGLAAGRLEPARPGEEGRRLVGSGGIPAGVDVAVVDPSTRERLPEGRVGEVWVRGASVAEGYWGRPVETAETFGATTADGDGPYLRSGDLGALGVDGSLFVTGRRKDLIIVRGRNVYPQDVEWSATASHPALRPGGAAAFAVEVDGAERVVVVAELERVGRAAPAAEVIDAIRRSASEAHELDLRAVRLLRPGALPRTSSGKVRRGACRDRFLADDLATVAAWTRDAAPAEVAEVDAPGDLRARLTAAVARALRVPAAEVAPDRPITAYGLDSLSAMELRAAIEESLGVELPLSTLLEGPTIDALAAIAERPSAAPVEPADEPAAADALAENQRSLWCAHHLSAHAGVHNIAGAATIRGAVDVDAFRAALQGVVDRHEGLRATFPAVDGRPALRVHPAMPVNFRHVDASAWPAERLDRDRDDEARRPFDLDDGPLHRVVLWSRSATEHVVLIGIHHIVGDFWSVAVVLDDFAALYEGRGAEVSLPPPARSYADFVRWQTRKLGGPSGERLSTYWKVGLSPPPPALNLPTDRPRPASRSQAGFLRTMQLDAGLTASLAELAAARGASMYATLLAALQVLLARYSGQDDITVGSPVAGRTPPGMEGVVGYFVNLVPMRSSLAGNPTFNEFLGRVRATVHEGLEHQDYPFGRMVEGLAQTLDPSRTPIFSVMFVYQQAQRLREAGLTPFALSTAGHRLRLAGLELESLTPEKRSALFDLTLMAARGENGLSMAMEASADLFDPPTIERLLGHFQTLLRSIVARPEARVDDLSILDEQEQRRLLESWSGGGAAAPRVGVVERFEQRAAATPDAPAVGRWSYRELDARASGLAARLREMGVGPGDFVGLCADRTPRLWAGVLGVLKAGAAYVPIDPSHPRGRSAFVLKDAGVKTCLVDATTRAAMAGLAPTLVDLDETAAGPAGGVEAREGDPAYVVYTSGSTGEPKGVVVSRGNLASAADGWEAAYGLDALRGPHLQMAGAAFDVFAGDWVRALCAGGSLVVCPRETLLDPAAIVALLARGRVAVAEFVPAIVEGVVDHLETTGARLPALRLVAVGSDVLRAGLYERLRRAVGPGVRVVNSYGLTEATIDSTFFEGPAGDADRPVPIGRPFAGTTAYVLDKSLRPVAAGLPGELFLGGPGVATGYLGRPALTADRFVPDPLGDAPGARLYRTGDLARWTPEGDLDLLGRADDQVKVRGQRVELGEVEAALRRDPEVRDAAVIARDGRLAAFVVAQGGPPAEAALRGRLRERLPEVMVPSTVAVLDRLPLSPNGKVDRRALAAIEAAAGPREVGRVAPRNEVEATLAAIVGALLGDPTIGVEDDLLALGIDSIQVIQLVARARAAGLAVDPMGVFRRPTIAGLAASVAPPRKAESMPRSAVDEALLARARLDDPGVVDAYDLTPVQHGMLFHALLDPEAGAYVEQFRCVLVGELDENAFINSWNHVIARHPALRTAIRWVDADRPVQVVFGAAEMPVERLDWRDAPPDEQARRLDAHLRDDRRRGFVLTFAPLLRLALIRLGAGRTSLVWTVHHAVVDGWCLPILLGEVLATYRGQAAALPPPRPFRAYLDWLRGRDDSAAEAYWRRVLAGFEGSPALGIDGPTAVEAAPFDEREVIIEDDDWAMIRALSRSARATLGTIVQGAWALLLSRYTGRPDVAFGVTVSGRPAELEGVESIVGVLINTLPMRVRVADEAAVGAWLAEVQGQQVEMRRYESTSLTQIQAWGEVPRGRPLFESVVIVQNTPAAAVAAGSPAIEEPRVHDQTNYPLTLSAIPGAALILRLGFDARRFDGGAIGRLLGHLRSLLIGMAEDPDRRLADLGLGLGGEGPVEGAAELSAAMLDGLSEAEIDAYLADLGVNTGEERP